MQGESHEFDEEEFDHEHDQYRDHDQEEEEYDDEGDEHDPHHMDVYHDSMDSPNHDHLDNSDVHHGRHDDDGVDDASDDLNASFQKDTHALTKVKAAIMYNINVEREKHGLTQMYDDITLSAVAMKFAQTLKNNDYDERFLNTLLEQHKNDHCRPDQKVDAKFDIAYIKSEYEEDANVTKQTTINYLIEIGYLFFERDEDSETLLRPANNHVGIGIAGNGTHVVVVLLITQHDLCITEITDKGDSIEVRGKMLQTSVGIFAAKIYNSQSFQNAKMKKDKDKDKAEPQPIFSVLYDKIDFDKPKKQFTIYLEMKPDWKEKRWIELLTRENPEGIAYRKFRKEKDNRDKSYMRHCRAKLRAKFIEYPDKEFQDEYRQLTEANIKKNQDLLTEQLKREEEQRIRLEEKSKIQQDLQQQQIDYDDKVASDDSDMQAPKGQENKDGTTSNKQIREELQLAITDARNTYESLMLTNKQLQQKIKQLKSKTQSYIDKTGETMNEHKYLNTLTQVHQTRVDLQTTQDRYNKMCMDLQKKLGEKQGKCNQIKQAFLQLKRQVAKKAAYSRSDQPIKLAKIEEWQEREKKLAEELQNLRLQILRSRNSLAKNEKILKKKQELAEGLHLIDFEQLKIENQTLNEKIEERNEELHKLKKKTTTVVQILTHTRQKLEFVGALKKDLKGRTSELDERIKKLRGDIGQHKQTCENLKTQIQNAKQETQIVNSQELVVDYKKITTNTKKLEKEIEDLKNREKEMKLVIQNYQRKMKKEVIKR